MLSLLALSLVLSAPAAATQPAITQAGPMVVATPELAAQPGEPMPPADAIEIHPSSDVCYKIRAYIFSAGRNPKFLRETTCGPKAPASKEIEGTKPRLMPLDLKAKPHDAAR